MAASRFPCRLCELPTAGVDSYVVCGACIDELESLNLGTARSTNWSDSRADDVVPSAQTQDEIDARVRKRHDEW